MEERKNELQFDEWEKLLGEIPNATSGNPQSENFRPKKGLMDDSLLPICVESCKEPFTEKIQYKGSLDEVKISANGIQISPIKMVQPEETNLPNDQSLTSTFAELCFNGAMIDKASSPPLGSYRLSNNKILLDSQYPGSLKKRVSNMDSQPVAFPSFPSPNNVPCSFDEFDVAKVVQESSRLVQVNAQELKQQQIGNYQAIENFSAAVPLGHGLQGFQFLSNEPIPGVMPEQQQYFMDAQYPLTYLHSKHINQPQINWRNVEEEQYYKMHQQYLCLQQLHNQQLEAQYPIQANGHTATRLKGQNLRQPYFEMPISHQLEKSNQEPLWGEYANPKGINQLSHAITSTDFSEMQFLNKVVKQSFPEKILSQSRGLNGHKAVKFGSVEGNGPISHLNQNGKDLSSGVFVHNFQSESLNSWCASPGTTDLKSATMRLQPQKYDSVDEVMGMIYFMAKDQHGCRFLQRKFSEGTLEDVEKIFVGIIDHIVELMVDPFGNYLVQKLLEVCDKDQHMQILHAITRKAGDLHRISCDMHGTRAVQKVIETLKNPAQFSLVVSSLKPNIVTLIKNMNGNHVAQRCLQYLKPEHSKFIFEAATTNCVELATDRYGCCVLQKCLIHAVGEQRHSLICAITSNSLLLSQDPFGNYVVQFVFDLRFPWATEEILDQLEGKYEGLSMQKYSSNVVEKCLKYAGEEFRAHIIQELINNPRLDQIMQDPYGNYVIQAALDQSKGALNAALVEAIRPHVPVLRSSPYGKKVLSTSSLKK